MKYSVDINKTISSLAYCLNKVNNEIDTLDWNININTCGIDYGIYFNFDIDKKELEICNQPRYDESLDLDEIIEVINGNEED